MKKYLLSVFAGCICSIAALSAQEVEPQPFISQAMRLNEALNYLGSSLADKDQKSLELIQHEPHTPGTVQKIQEILDPYCLAEVHINPEGRVKTAQGPASPKLIQGGWTTFLVKIHNETGATSSLEVESPNALPPWHRSSFSHRVLPEHVIRAGSVANRFLDVQMYRNKPLSPRLSGLKLEYAVVQLYSRDAGKREAEIGFHAGQGSQDIGFRNTTHILFDIQPAVKVVFDIRDVDGTPAMASFIIKDGVERAPGTLANVYPLPSRRVAAHDEYPDFFFQPQVYRTTGEYVLLPPGDYEITYSRGPEYLPRVKHLTVPEEMDSITASFQLERWIHLAEMGWYSADHHVHASGCSHYDSPEEGVRPEDMWRQALGEDLNVASILTWGPSWYHQKQFFTGHSNPLSTRSNLIHYDVEVSGFPSSHAGHLVLLRLKEDDYPGAERVEDWPSWTLPILRWARAQGGLGGYAHSGWGLKPLQDTKELPNYITPHMDYIGANEYVATVAHDAVDFYSVGDTPAPWELNMWYHTLNCGFRIPLSGETDFPCITDERVGNARSYFKTGKSDAVNYHDFTEAIKQGRNYVSDGRSHILDFKVNGLEAGTAGSELALTGEQSVRVEATLAAYLPPKQAAAFQDIGKRSLSEGPYWHLERARMGQSRNVQVELIANGQAVDTAEITANGILTEVVFDYLVSRPVWLALRVFPSSHSNPVYITLDGKPIVEPRSVQWCMEALDQCWRMKSPHFKESDRAAAQEAYQLARQRYERLLSR